MKIIPTDYKTQVKIFELAGCKYMRTRGDHLNKKKAEILFKDTERVFKWIIQKIE